MDIRKLPNGEIAPEDSDCIKVTRISEGRFVLATSALIQCKGTEEAVSEAIIGTDEYDSYEEAERSGLAWAEERSVELIYIETA